MDLADLARVKREGLPNDGLITLGICSRNIGDDSNPTRGTVTIEMAKKEWSGARELGLPITLHASGPEITKLLNTAGLLGPDVQFVHPTGTSAEDRAILAAKGVSYSMSPIGESRRPGNAGVIQLGELLEFRREGVDLDRSRHHLQLRSVRRHAAALFDECQSPPGQGQNHHQAAGRACDHRWRARSRACRQDRVARRPASAPI